MQNSTHLPRKLHIVRDYNVRLDSERQVRIAVAKALLPHFQRHSESVHQRPIRVPESVKAAAPNPQPRQ